MVSAEIKPFVMEVAPTYCLVFGGFLALQRGAQAAAGDDVPVSLRCLPRRLQGETTRRVLRSCWAVGSNEGLP